MKFPNFKTIKGFYDRNLWSVERVKKAVEWDYLTADEFKTITGEDYTDQPQENNEATEGQLFYFGGELILSDFILNFLQLKPYDWALTFAVAALFLEFLSGLLKALRNHTLKSSIGLLGFGKHMLIFFGFVVVFYLVVAFPTPPMNIGFGETDLGDIAAFGFCILYIFFLLVSIVENLDGAGIKLPKFLTKYLYETNDTLMNGDVKDIAKLGAKTLESAKNPTATLHNLLDEEAIAKNGNRSNEENKDDLSDSKPEKTEEPQQTKKDPQNTSDEFNKPNRLN